MKREEAVEIYKEEARKFDGTRSIQWKFNIGVWTLVALGIQFKENLGLKSCFGSFIENSICFSLHCILSLVISIVVGIAIILIHYRFAYKIQYSLECNKVVKTDIITKLNSNASKGKDIQVDTRLKPTKPFENRFYHWINLQVLITLILVLIFLFKDI